MQQLQKLATKSKGRLQVHISRNNKFHWKYYGFETKSKAVSYIGSANFTRSGMTDTGELQAKLTLNPKDSLLKENLNSLFNKAWENSADIAIVPLEKYKEAKQPKGGFYSLDPEIKRILFEKSYKRNINKPQFPEE